MSSEPPSQQSLPRTLAFYLALLLGGVGLFLLIRQQGNTLTAPEPTAPSGRAASVGHSDILFRVLIALGAVIVVGQILGRLLRFLSQPPVIGEVLGGILLGPSLLGEEVSRQIIPGNTTQFLGIIAQLGVILYLFVVGLELDLAALGRRAQATVLISHAGIVVPFLLGAVLALFLYPRLSSSAVAFDSFALFLGVAMAVTAFPVLARILSDCRLKSTALGSFALACAAVGDATAWCLLAVVVGVARARVDQSLLVIAGTLAYTGIMLLVVRPVLSRILQRGDGPVGRGMLGLMFALLLLSAAATEAIGIHALFGAFLFGAIIPHDSAVARLLGRQLEEVVLLLLLPAFFAITGLRTRIDLVTGLDQWLLCGLIILVATLGKFGGTFLAARWVGMSWQESALLGTLMNTRGLMELIVLNVGLDLKVISPELFSMLVVMALITTVLTAPVLRLLRVNQPVVAAKQPE